MSRTRLSIYLLVFGTAGVVVSLLLRYALMRAGVPWWAM